MSLLGVGFAAVAAVGLTVQSFAVRIGTRTHPVAHVVAVMFAVNLLVLVPVVAVVVYPAYGVTTRALAAFAAAGLIGSLLARYCYFLGIARLGSSRTEPLKALFPVVAVGSAVVFLGERPSVAIAAGVGLLVVASVVVAADARKSPVTPAHDRIGLVLLYPLAAALFLGIDPVFTKVGLAEGTPALVGVTIRVGAAAAGFGCYLAWRRLRHGGGRSFGLNRWLVVASLANTGYLLAYYAALARAPVSAVTPVLGISTLLVVLGAAVFLQEDERVTGRLVGAAVLVVVGLAFVVRG